MRVRAKESGSFLILKKDENGKEVSCKEFRTWELRKKDDEIGPNLRHNAFIGLSDISMPALCGSGPT